MGGFIVSVVVAGLVEDGGDEVEDTVLPVSGDTWPDESSLDFDLSTYVLKMARPKVASGSLHRALSRLLGSFLCLEVAQRLLRPPWGLVKTATTMKPTTNTRSRKINNQRRNFGAPLFKQRLIRRVIMV